MATVRHFGLLPWCPWPSYDAFLKWLGGGIIPEDLSIYDLTAVNNLRFDSVALALAAYWRVRKWRVTGQTWFGIGSGLVDILNIDRVIERNNVFSEQDLICWDGTDDSKKWGAFLINSFSNGIAFNIQIPGSPVYGIPPSIQATGWFATVFIGGNDEGLFPTVTTVKSPEDEFFSIELNLLGQQQSIGARIASVETPQEVQDDPSWQGYVGFKITADEYWPYDPNDGGGPIYDKATGKQLRPFP